MSQLNDLMFAYYTDLGGVGDTLNDVEYDFLIKQAIPPMNLNDMRYQWLYNLGYRGALGDMEQEFWCSDAGVVDGSPLVTHERQFVYQETIGVTHNA